MKKGFSYISFHVKEKPNHPIVKALKSKYGNKYDEAFIIYASHWSSNAGWTLNGLFLGFTIEESIQAIKKATE